MWNEKENQTFFTFRESDFPVFLCGRSFAWRVFFTWFEKQGVGEIKNQVNYNWTRREIKICRSEFNDGKCSELKEREREKTEIIKKYERIISRFNQRFHNRLTIPPVSVKNVYNFHQIELLRVEMMEKFNLLFSSNSHPFLSSTFHIAEKMVIRFPFIWFTK